MRKSSLEAVKRNPLEPAAVLLKWWSIAVLLDAVWITSLGLVILLGGERRLSGPSFVSLVAEADMLGFSPVLWGLPAITSGLMLIAGVLLNHPLLRCAAYLFGTGASANLAIAGAFAVQRQPQAALTGIVTYAFTSLLQLTMLWASVQISVLRRAG